MDTNNNYLKNKEPILIDINRTPYTALHWENT